MSDESTASNQTPASPALEAARELDLAGRHNEAIELLRKASLQGDLPAMSELGHRVLSGDRAPLSALHGLAFVREAAKRGEARAMTLVAALMAAGAYLKQDWPGALQLLGEAAAAGSAAARGQLAALQPAGATPADWSTMASRVPLEEWLQPAAQVQLHEHVRQIPAMVPPAACAWLIHRGSGRQQRAIVYDSVSRSNVVHSMRTNTMAVFDYTTIDVVQFLLQARMSLTCGYPMQHFETPQILHYNVGEQITPHFDFIDAQAADYARQIQEKGQRMITFLLYLNDEYEGGETTFPELGIVHRGTKGNGLYFINAHPDLKPDRRMLHTGSPPVSGEKWIVTQFIVSKTLRP
jgi:hypothetical protein